MSLRRRTLLVAPLALAACAGQAPPRRTVFPPLRYDYLLKLPLNVASIDFAPPPPPGPLADQNPAPPIDILTRMARDRLVAAGSSGRALVTIEQADITPQGRDLNGVLTIQLEIFDPAGKRVGFAEARVTRTYTGDLSDLRGTLYDMTAAMMDDMNVELEYQVRRSLKDYLQDTSTAPVPTPVQQQPLTPPPAGGAAAPPAS